MVDTAIFAISKRERNRARKSALEVEVKRKNEQVSALSVYMDVFVSEGN
jgi:hypothetical protein